MKELSIGNRLRGNGESNGQSSERPAPEEVDALADLLVETYSTPDYRAWYCKLIYRYGIRRVNEWYMKSLGGKSPGRLFSSYAKGAEKQESDKPSPLAPTRADDKSAVCFPADEDLTDEAIAQNIGDAIRQYGLAGTDVPRVEQRKNPWENS